MTGWGRPEDDGNTEEGAFDVHFTKPVDFARLLHHAIVGLLSVVRGDAT